MDSEEESILESYRVVEFQLLKCILDKSTSYLQEDVQENFIAESEDSTLKNVQVSRVSIT